MADIDLLKSSKTVWQNVFSKVNKAVVFVDDPLAECLHWCGGAAALIQCGALNVKQFSSFESGLAEERKAVFLISESLVGTTELIIQDILQSSHFEYVIVITSLHPAIHTLSRYGQVEDETKAFHYMEDKLLEWMGNMNYSAEILYTPIASASISPQLFVLPGHQGVFPLLPSDWDYLIDCAENLKVTYPTPADLDVSNLSEDLQLKIKLLAYGLNSHMEQLGVGDDVFSLGHTSKLIATELANLTVARQRRKSSQKKASILIVDRTLDLPNVLGHHGETVMDKILSNNEKFPGHQNDISIDMSSLCSIISNPNNSVVAAGCLAQNVDHNARSLLHILLTQKQKEAVMEVNRQVVETASREGLNINLAGRPGRVSTDQLTSHISAFKGKTAAIQRNAGILQIVQGVLQTLKSPLTTKHDSLLAVEKGLLQVLAEPGVSPLNQVIQLLEKEIQQAENEREFTVEEILGLFTFVYSLYNDHKDIERHQEDQLRTLLVRLLMDTEEKNLPSVVTDSVTSSLADEVTDVVGKMMHVLQSLTQSRKGLNRFSSVYEPGGLASQTALKPLLKQIMSEVLQESKQEIPDIEYVSTGFRDHIKRGLGLFMKMSKPRPGDHPLLIIFVVGGITSSELRIVREAVTASKSSLQVILGSTCLVTPSDIVSQVLKSRT